jgi:hypothetical protein
VLRKEPEFDGTATFTVTSVEPPPFATVAGERVYVDPGGPPDAETVSDEGNVVAGATGLKVKV